LVHVIPEDPLPFVAGWIAAYNICPGSTPAP